MGQTAQSKYCLYVRQDLADLGEDFFDAREFHGMKSDTYMYKALKDHFQTLGISLHTQYKHSPEESEVVFCLNETSSFRNYRRSAVNRKLILILTEPPVYNEDDWKIENHRCFDAVVSYARDLSELEPSKYHFSPFPIALNRDLKLKIPDEMEFRGRKLSCMIAGAFTITEAGKNKRSLLYERYKILKWFNRNAPDYLDFYSRTNPINKFRHFHGAAILSFIHSKIPERIGKLLFRKNLSSVYKGAIPGTDKNKVMASYRFNICLENSFGIRGLISEKIFDCFESGTVPVYYGAPDIADYIPKTCFVDYQDYKSPKELLEFLKGMEYKTYISYLESAAQFIKNDAEFFSTERFVEHLSQLSRP